MRGSGLAGARILMVPNLGHEAGVTGTTTRRPHKNGNYVGWALRTLTARIHSAFSLVLNALHSLRIAGLVQVGGVPVQDTETADQKTARATGKSVRTNMARWGNAQMLVKTASQFMALEPIAFVA